MLATIVRSRRRAWRLGVASLVLALASAGFGPSGDGAKVTKEQLAYSKQMFGEGEKAMAAGDYALALEKFREGYRYAPHLHLFNFNIASAADAAGDCLTAKTHFQMFVDLVEKHPKRKDAKTRLEALAKSCTAADVETPPSGPAPTDAETPSEGSGRMSREEREDVRVMSGALEELRTAQARYEAAKARHPSIKAFGRAARAKKTQVKKLRKAAVEAGITIEDRPVPSIEVPTAGNQACREAESQENRIIEAVTEVIDRFDDAKVYKAASKALRVAERRDRGAFDACG